MAKILTDFDRGVYDVFFIAWIISMLLVYFFMKGTR